ATFQTRSGRIPPEPRAEPELNAPTQSSPSPAASQGIPSTAVRVKSWFAGRSHAIQRTLSFGDTASIEGTAVDSAGAALEGKTLLVRERPIGVASQVGPARTVKTNAKGHFVYRLAPGPSRVVEFAYGA